MTCGRSAGSYQCLWSGADIWNINALESVGREYSRHINNVTNLYAPDPFRASDHDPEIVGFGTRSAD